MKNIIHLLIFFIISSCGIYKPAESPKKRVIVDYYHLLEYQRYYNVDSDLNKIKFNYAQEELEFIIGRYDEFKVLDLKNNQAIIQRNQGGIISYLLLNQLNIVRLNISEIKDLQYYKGFFYLFADNKLWRVTSSGLKLIDNLGNYNGNILIQYNKLFYAKYDQDWMLASFDGQLVKYEIIFNYDSILEFGAIGDSLIGLYTQDQNLLAFDYNKEDELTNLTVNDFKLPISVSNNKIILKDSEENQELFLINKLNLIEEPLNLFYMNNISYKDNIFLAKDDSSKNSGSIFHLNKQGNLIELLSSIDGNSFVSIRQKATINNITYFIVQDEGNNLFLMDYKNNQVSIIRELSEEFIFYKENNILYLQKTLNGLHKIYDFNGNFVRNIRKLN